MSNYFSGDKDADAYIFYSILSQLKYKSGSDRYKLCKTSVGNGSILYGNTWRGFLKYNPDGTMKMRERDPKNPAKFLSTTMLEYPEIMDIAEEYRDLYFPEFEFTHLMLNKNYPVDWHFDNANIGKSYIVAFGDYEGGETELRVDGKVLSFNINNNPISFNGHLIEHRCAPFTGSRYAVVFFKN